jgi:hypothetical protein
MGESGAAEMGQSPCKYLGNMLGMVGLLVSGAVLV